jgi:hypothetical protein
MVRGAVVTVALKGEAAVAITFIVAGTEQFALVGAPVQVRVTVPLLPSPPTEGGHLVNFPAVAVAGDRNSSQFHKQSCTGPTPGV